MRLPPVEVYLTWPKPNYINPHINPLATVFYVFNGVLLALATIAVAARLYARMRLRNWFGLDDLFIVLAWIPAVGLATALLLGYLRYKWDRHVYDIPLRAITPSVKILFASKILFAFSSCFTRISLVLFFYRILDHIQINKYRWILHITMAFIWGTLISWTFVTIFNCVPVSAYWNVFEPANTRCINGGLALFILSIINTFEELIVALLPVPVVFRLRMGTKQRLGVISLLSLGILVAIIGAVRSYYVWLSVTSYDLTWYSTPHWICAIVEVNVAIICACVPALRHLFRGKVLMPWGSQDSSKKEKTQQKVTQFTQKSMNGPRGISERYHPYASPNAEGVYQTINFDGNDGDMDEKDMFGHSVMITSDAPRQGGRKTYGRLSQDWRVSLDEKPASEESSANIDPEDIGCRKSLEIRVSYHEGSNDVKSLHIQRPRQHDGYSTSFTPTSFGVSASASDDGLMDGSTKPASSWLVDETSSERSTDSDDDSDSGSDNSDDEKPFAYNIGVAVPQRLTATKQQDSEKGSVNLSDFEFDSRVISRGSSQSPATSSEARRAPEPPVRHLDLLRPTAAFVRRSLSTIASENTRGDQRSSVNRSSGDPLSLLGNFSPTGLPEIRRNRTAADNEHDADISETEFPKPPEPSQQRESYYSHRRQQSSKSSGRLRSGQPSPVPSASQTRRQSRHTPSPTQSPRIGSRASQSSPSQTPRLGSRSHPSPSQSPRVASRASQASQHSNRIPSRNSQHTQHTQPTSRSGSRRQSARQLEEEIEAQQSRPSRPTSQAQRGHPGNGSEWWLQYSPPEPSEPTDGTLWSFAFNRVFSPQRGLAGGAGLDSATSTDSDETQQGETSSDDNFDFDFANPNATASADDRTPTPHTSRTVREERVLSTSTPYTPTLLDPVESPKQSWFDNRESLGSSVSKNSSP